MKPLEIWRSDKYEIWIMARQGKSIKYRYSHWPPDKANHFCHELEFNSTVKIYQYIKVNTQCCTL